MMLANKRVFVAGHRGLVGSAFVRALQAKGLGGGLLTADKADLDLRDQAAVRAWFGVHKPDIVILAAAYVGGISANAAQPVSFLYDNLMIEANVIHSAYENGAEKLLFLGSSCIYPKDAPQPIKPQALLTGALEDTNRAYAVAKITGIELCRAYRAQYGCDFISLMPCNVYGPEDRFDPARSHVIAALMARLHAAKLAGEDCVQVWGTGRPRREFLYSDDVAQAGLLALEHYSHSDPLNVGAGEDISIADLAALLADIIGFSGRLVFDPTKPDGVMGKLMDRQVALDMGWRPQTTLRDGLLRMYRAYQEGYQGQRAA